MPSLVYLPDIVPGWSVKLLGKVAKRVAVTHTDSLPYFPKGKVVVTGYPVRSDLTALSKTAARRRLGLPEHSPVLLIWGGSRGARSINEAVFPHVDELIKLATLVHITGTDGIAKAQATRQALSPALQDGYRVYEYLNEEFGAALAAADLTVSRAGASIMGEYPAVGLPSVLVPYPELIRQQENALALVKAGGAMMIADEALHGLLPVLRELLNRPERLARMSEAVRTLAPGKPASEAIGEILAGLASLETSLHPLQPKPESVAASREA
jgi:UDP-N-acetylglucosamine--N-acetylmuramyl-(pentapeptide) pyrophosphoryl-undecaprenol N-acetylglucosamine transferase